MEDVESSKFADTVFQDHRWADALTFLRGLDNYGPERVRAVLLKGAETFGLWSLPEVCTDGLVSQVMGGSGGESLAMQHLKRLGQGADLYDGGGTSSSIRVSRAGTVRSDHIATYKSDRMSRMLGSRLSLSRLRQSLRDADGVQWTSRLFSVVIFIIANAYALKVVFQMYPDATKVLLWPIYLARMGGMAAACWTGVLYWSMARGFLSKMYRLIGPLDPRLLTPLDAHKDLHVYSGMALVACGAEHIVAHMLGTVPGLLTHTKEELNQVLGCANTDSTPGMISTDLSALHWPKCPLAKAPRSLEEVFILTMPGLSGLLLVVVLLAMAYTGRPEGRKQRFDLFYYVHNVGLVVWPVLLFLHGSNVWVGVGLPLVVFTASLPFALYLLDRAGRLLRYFLFAGGAVRIVNATVRPGTGKDPSKGSLCYLEVTRPPFLWNFRTGMYAFICLPDYAPLQWHPFTICSGDEDETVDFLIAGVGDWTRELTSRCLRAEQEEGSSFPKIALDGPYMAPTQSALTKQVLIAVGAGVGITPFLSLMSTIISGLDGKKHRYKHLLEVHFYWMARNANEFMFGRRLFTRIFRSERLSQKVFIHLHVTAQVPNRDAPALLFREALKRQSKIDREAYSKLDESQAGKLKSTAGALLPWCWENSASEDILWVADLLEAPKAEVEADNPDVVGSPESTGFPCRSWYSRMQQRTMSFSTPTEELVPLVFGRPNFATEMRAIGKARPGVDVDTYVCGNDAVVSNLFDIAAVCNQHAEADAKEGKAPKQTYRVHFERFS